MLELCDAFLKSGMWKLLYLAGGSSPRKEDDDETNKTASRALPSNWYTSQEMYELERRAIFSKKWQLITHRARLTNVGDWLRFDIANYQILLCKDRQGSINGFHNVCRHRAFPVVSGAESGSARIFSCKYHGWSYGLHGGLAKAPGYQELSGFDKSKNGLLPVHLHIDVNGFIWVNLDAQAEPEIAWEDDLGGIDTQERYQQFNFEDYEFDHVWQMDGEYNWKILADNYNECYHCKVAHPDISSLADLQSYGVTTQGASIIHDPATTEEQRRAGLVVASTYYFPNASTNISPHFFMIQRFVPSSARACSMQYQVFRNRHSSAGEFECVNQIYKRIMAEDKALCDAAQRNLNGGVFVNGELHPRMEKGPLYFQRLVREAVTAHRAREEALGGGGEIWPAKQMVPAAAAGSERSFQDAAFCAGLAAPCHAANSQLVW